jgi:hypothetical protein
VTGNVTEAAHAEACRVVAETTSHNTWALLSTASEIEIDSADRLFVEIDLGVNERVMVCTANHEIATLATATAGATGSKWPGRALRIWRGTPFGPARRAKRRPTSTP